jgi:hypothetical protein
MGDTPDRSSRDRVPTVDQVHADLRHLRGAVDGLSDRVGSVETKLNALQDVADTMRAIKRWALPVLISWMLGQNALDRYFLPVAPDRITGSQVQQWRQAIQDALGVAGVSVELPPIPESQP